MLEYIYVCRHGFRSNWFDPSIKTSPTGMNRDPPLAAYGTAQSLRLATFLSNPDSLAPYPPPERVFSSPFYRCIETAVPTAHALGGAGLGRGDVGLEHGVMEWYSTVNPNTGLHPRPSSPFHLATLFPKNSIDTTYNSTLFPSRRGESLRDLQDRADLFVEAWTSRIEATGARCVVVFAHAASVIALGRALTGDKTLSVGAGCASCSLYRRKGVPPPSEDVGLTASRSTSSLAAASSLLDLASSGDAEPCGVGEWSAVWLGRADYLENGVERDWSFRDVEIRDGEVINDDGYQGPHPPEDEIPTGLVKGMEKYLRRGMPPGNGPAPESGLKGRM